jgi:hypothetical protein
MLAYPIGVFRRRSTEDQAAKPAPAAESAPTGGKGRPTPKRREAEQARKARVRPPLTRREQMKRERQRVKEQRTHARQAMSKGDERYFLKRDQGDVRRFIRDYVDARRTIAEFFLPIILIVLLSSFIPIAQVQIFSTLFMFATMLMVIFDLVYLNIRVKREIRRRFPDDTQRGHGLYAIARATQIRRLRLPKPNVRPGETV